MLKRFHLLGQGVDFLLKVLIGGQGREGEGQSQQQGCCYCFSGESFHKHSFRLN
jgi:hypothetical protein